MTDPLSGMRRVAPPSRTPLMTRFVQLNASPHVTGNGSFHTPPSTPCANQRSRTPSLAGVLAPSRTGQEARPGGSPTPARARFPPRDQRRASRLPAMGGGRALPGGSRAPGAWVTAVRADSRALAGLRVLADPQVPAALRMRTSPRFLADPEALAAAQNGAPHFLRSPRATPPTDHGRAPSRETLLRCAGPGAVTARHDRLGGSVEDRRAGRITTLDPQVTCVTEIPSVIVRRQSEPSASTPSDIIINPRSRTCGPLRDGGTGGIFRYQSNFRSKVN